jgi:hypothetical protein
MALAAGAVLAFTLEAGRVVYGLQLLDGQAWLECGVITAIAIAVLEAALRVSRLTAPWVARHIA